MSGAPDPAWAAGIRRVRHHARGVLALDVVRRADMPGVLIAALAGNAGTVQLTQQVNDTLRRTQDAPAHEPMQCACCGPTLGAINAAAQRALRSLWPDLRPVSHPKGGRA